jgi:ABC-type sugar transport system permease subunit
MTYIGLDNYIRAFTVDRDFNRLLVDTLKGLLIDAPCIIIFSLIIAIMLNRNFPGRGLVRAIFFMPVILASGVVLGMDKANTLLMGIQELQGASVDTSISTTVQNLLLGALGSRGQEIVTIVSNIINHFYDIVVASSIQIVIFLSALQTINPAIYEAADMEGCDEWQKLWKITIPMLTPMILVNWIYTIIDQFVRADNVIMDKIMTTIRSTMEYGFASAMAWIYCLIMLAIIGISTWIISKVVYYYE